MCEIMEKLRAEGVEEGRAQGRAEGLAEGLDQGKIENMKITAIKMYQKGMDRELIAEITGLSLEEVDELCKDQ